MNYKETVKYLFSLLPIYQRIGKAAYKKNLNNTIELDKFFGHPHKFFKSVHIAGTNGKGSVSHFLASIFQEAGCRVGLYTSPHLKDYRERIKINGIEIEEDFVVEFVKRAKPMIEKIKPSFFELTVIMSFVYFKEKKVDLAVIETGLGGRLDSTNIVLPLVSVITNISFDHSEFLGDTLEKIAKEKAGIIKPNIPVIIGEKKKRTFEVFKNVASEKKAPLIVASDKYKVDYVTELPNGYINLNVKDYDGNTVYKNLKSSLKGQYQIQNIITSIVTIETLNEKYKLNISRNDLYKGFENVVDNTGIKGRWQIIRYNPTVILDIAHNEDAIKTVVLSLKGIPYKNLRIVLGFVNDKNLDRIISLLPKQASYYVTQASVPRAKDAYELAHIIKSKGLKVNHISQNAKASLQKAILDADSDDLVMVIGSAFVVADVL